MTGVKRIRLMARVASLAAFGAAIFSAAVPVAAQSAPPARLAQAPAVAKPAPQPLAAPVKTTHEIVARVGDADVTADELRAYVAGLQLDEQAALAKDPALLVQAIRQLLANRLVLQEAVAKKWDQQPNVEAQLDRIRERAVVELYLQSVSAPPAGFPSDEELQKTYEANRAAFLMPRQYQLAQIFVASPKDADKADDDSAKKKIDEIERKLKAPGADFAAIASGGNDAKDGGDLGWVAEGQIRPEIRAQITGLAKNAITEPIRLDDGWHILKLVDTKAAYTRSLAEAHDQLVQQMRAERSAMLRRAYLGELLKQHPPVVNELALSNLLDNSRK